MVDITMNKANNPVRGEEARLIPVVSDGSRENRATSIFMASMTVVPALAREVLQPLGVRVGKRTRITALTEVSFEPNGKSDAALRPDGFLRVETSRSSVWTALIEAKIGNSSLSGQQVSNYIDVAKNHGIDAVITVSNKFVALPSHPAVSLPRRLPKRVDLFHLSWINVVTQAELLLGNDDDFDDEEQRYILREMVRYFSHPSVGVSKFDRMGSSWREVVKGVQSNAKLAKSSDAIQETVASWHQETRDLALMMARVVSRPVNLKLPKSHRQDPSKRLKDDADGLVTRHALTCQLSVPDAASELSVSADVMRRSIEVGMRLQAPTDRKQAKSRVSWLLRQLKGVTHEDIYVRAHWPGSSPWTQASLDELLHSPELLYEDKGRLVPTQFDVLLVRDLAGKFSGSRTFIESLEDAVFEFYNRVGQNLKAYVAPAPAVKKPAQKAPLEDEADETQSS